MNQSYQESWMTLYFMECEDSYFYLKDAPGLGFHKFKSKESLLDSEGSVFKTVYIKCVFVSIFI